MPKELTHWLIADQALAGLNQDSQLRRTIEAHYNVYLAGAILPDTLLHLHNSTHSANALTLAHSFHDTADNSFAALIQAEEHFTGDIPPATLACLLGVITHIETDIIFHPFVYALTGSAGIGRHYQIETDIDSYFLHNGTIPAYRHLTDIFSAETQETLISTCALLFDSTGTLPHSALKQALAQHRRFQSMYDKKFWKLAVKLLAITIGSPFREQQHLFYPLSRSSAVCCVGDDAQKWQHPFSGERRYNTIKELANEATSRIIALFTLIETQGSLSAALTSMPGENLLTGLHGVQRSAINS